MDPLEAAVRNKLAERVGPDLVAQLGAEVEFAEVGIDSIDVVVVLADLEREFGSLAHTSGDLPQVGRSIAALTAHLSRAGMTP